jgi:hypothetical protein
MTALVNKITVSPSTELEHRREVSTTPLGSGRRRRRLAPGVVVAGVTAAVVLVQAGVGVGSAHAAAVHLSTVDSGRVGVVMAVNSLPTIVANLRTWVMGLLAGLATLFLTIGGVRYLMAGGDPSQVERAKAAFRSALIGYAMAVLAPVVLTILISIIGS